MDWSRNPNGFSGTIVNYLLDSKTRNYHIDTLVLFQPKTIRWVSITSTDACLYFANATLIAVATQWVSKNFLSSTYLLAIP